MASSTFNLAKRILIATAASVVASCSTTSVTVPETITRLEFPGFSFEPPHRGWTWKTGSPGYLAIGATSGPGFDAQMQVIMVRKLSEPYTENGKWAGYMTALDKPAIEVSAEPGHGAPCKRWKTKVAQQINIQDARPILASAVLNESGIECINPVDGGQLIQFRYFHRSPAGVPQPELDAQARAFFDSVRFKR